ncbi:hypothetical protein Pelo_18390 [Pelomyxa schiedti]|nr:hypothetical protein Pelo_18390 [Pelomyxa schiedti]
MHTIVASVLALLSYVLKTIAATALSCWLVVVGLGVVAGVARRLYVSCTGRVFCSTLFKDWALFVDYALRNVLLTMLDDPERDPDLRWKIVAKLLDNALRHIGLSDDRYTGSASGYSRRLPDPCDSDSMSLFSAAWLSSPSGWRWVVNPLYLLMDAGILTKSALWCLYQSYFAAIVIVSLVLADCFWSLVALRFRLMYYLWWISFCLSYLACTIRAVWGATMHLISSLAAIFFIGLLATAVIHVVVIPFRIALRFAVSTIQVMWAALVRVTRSCFTCTIQLAVTVADTLEALILRRPPRAAVPPPPPPPPPVKRRSFAGQVALSASIFRARRRLSALKLAVSCSSPPSSPPAQIPPTPVVVPASAAGSATKSNNSLLPSPPQSPVVLIHPGTSTTPSLVPTAIITTTPSVGARSTPPTAAGSLFTTPPTFPKPISALTADLLKIGGFRKPLTPARTSVTAAPQPQQRQRPSSSSSTPPIPVAGIQVPYFRQIPPDTAAIPKIPTPLMGIGPVGPRSPLWRQKLFPPRPTVHPTDNSTAERPADAGACACAGARSDN